ncbi:MAG: FkbM family methyltransferase [Acidimicrobiales bacterium]|nr:FkbM family methyltransferase [Acidimicrobiales bacterium]
MNGRAVFRKTLPKLFRAYPLKSGTGTIANSRAVRSLIGAWSDDVTAKVGGGSRLLVRSDDLVGRAVILFGDLDPKVTWVVDRLLRPGDNVLDIGANWGLVTIRAARRVQATGHVHAIEPQESLVAYGRASVEQNRYSNITFHPIALSDAAGMMTLTVPSDNSGAAYLGQGLDGRPGRSQTVTVEETSTFLESLTVQRWRLWKIDVEGHEAAVLRGALRYLRGHQRPDVILFEEHRKPTVDAESVRLLQSLGYDMFGMPRAIFRLRLQPLTRERDTAHDVVAVNRDSRPELERALRIARRR